VILKGYASSVLRLNPSVCHSCCEQRIFQFGYFFSEEEWKSHCDVVLGGGVLRYWNKPGICYVVSGCCVDEVEDIAEWFRTR
jgi:hypothetical protein